MCQTAFRIGSTFLIFIITFGLSACGGGGGGGGATATNNPPTAMAITGTVPSDTPATIGLTATDPEGNSLTWTITSPPANGTLTGTGPNFVYTSDPGYTGPDSFSFSVNDGTSDSNIATVDLTVKKVWHADKDATGAADGTSWADAFLHPQDAVDTASAGDHVWVAEGIYVRRNAVDTVVLTMKVGVEMYGGFVGTEGYLEARNYELNETTLDGEGVAWHVVFGTTNARFDGFTVTGGVTTSGGWPNFNGGGMIIPNGTGLTVANCIFTNNTGGQGSAIYSGGGSLTVSNTTFFDNDSTGVGCGIFAEPFNGAASVTITDSVFVGNDCNTGGAIALNSGSVNVFNSTFAGNTGLFGGVLSGGNAGSTANFTNSSFSGNTATTQGGAIYYGGPLTLTNSIIWGNTAPTDPSIAALGPATVRYSNIEGGFMGTGNIDADPLFVDADGVDNIVGTADDNLRLSTGSPSIDAADGDVAPTLDKDGNSRVDDPAIANTGVGATVDYADMGAYEFQP